MCSCMLSCKSAHAGKHANTHVLVRTGALLLTHASKHVNRHAHLECTHTQGETGAAPDGSASASGQGPDAAQSAQLQAASVPQHSTSAIPGHQDLQRILAAALSAAASGNHGAPASISLAHTVGNPPVKYQHVTHTCNTRCPPLQVGLRTVGQPNPRPRKQPCTNQHNSCHTPRSSSSSSAPPQLSLVPPLPHPASPLAPRLRQRPTPLHPCQPGLTGVWLNM